jgi:hypothetical protein
MKERDSEEATSRRRGGGIRPRRREGAKTDAKRRRGLEERPVSGVQFLADASAL